MASALASMEPIIGLTSLVARAVQEGYRKTREMEQCEKDVFVDFMRVALLCNASWRFMNFNIDHPELRETHGDQYKELQDRIEQLEKPDVVQSVRALLLASAKP
eukprot:scaffold3768_cov376-Prasinococcus_capsulatus_cf.AAC.24